MYTHLMLPLCETYRVRCIALDRRGFGQSEWCGTGGGDLVFEDFARDVVGVLKGARPEVGDFVFVASSMGCGESLLAWERSGWITDRCRVRMQREMKMNETTDGTFQTQGFIWIRLSLPHSVHTDSNLTAPLRELWDSILAGFRANRPSFTHVALPG